MNYSKNAAIAATKSQMAPTYINVWAFVSGEVTDRDTAKKELSNFARQRAGVTVGDIFDEYKRSVGDGLNELEHCGHFDF